MTNAYKHTQIGYTLIVAYCIVILLLGMLASVADFRRIVVIGLLVMLLALSTFATLTITVNDRTLQLRYGVGLIKKRFPLNEIAAGRVMKNPWYYGWGIRYTPRGWPYSVSGLHVVELDMRNGKQVCIGSDEPRTLVAALETAMKRKNHPSIVR